MRPDDNDSDWLYPVDCTADTIPAPASSQPIAIGVWVCGGLDAEPCQYATLLEATTAPPASPYAIVAGAGELLAQSAEDVAQWVMTPEGSRRLSLEMSAAVERDYDRFLAIVLEEDLSFLSRRSA